MNELELNVTIDEANMILEGLGNLPFARVFALIAKIQEQASGQIRRDVDPGAASLGGTARSAAESVNHHG
jgi:hypothetical protein